MRLKGGTGVARRYASTILSHDVGTAAARPLENQHGTDVPRVVLALRQEEHQVEHRDRDTHGFSTLRSPDRLPQSARQSPT